MSAVLPLPVKRGGDSGISMHWQDRIAHVGLLVVTLVLVVVLLAPICMIFMKSVQDKNGHFVGLAHFIDYMSTPALLQSVLNSVSIAIAVTLITIPAAFTFAYGITRSCMPMKSLVRNIALIPLLAPTLLSAISFIYLFGNQGLLKGWMGGHQIYGAPGMLLSMVYSTFPHALMILITALSLTDARLYEAADSLGASARRKFFTITLPAAKYGLISATMLVFTIVINDFGVPKVIGGNFNVLSTDVYKLVIGQQDFAKGSVVGLLLLLPAALTFVVDYFVRRKQKSQLSARSVPYHPKPKKGFDFAMTLYCGSICLLMLAVLSMAVYASFIKLWPYDFSMSLKHYRVGLIGSGVFEAYINSVKMAVGVSVGGTVLVFVGAYLMEKTRGLDWVRTVLRLLAVLPMAVPGLVLGLGCIFFFNNPGNPFNFLYGTMAILVLSTIVHYYSSSHMTAVTALKALDNEFEAVSASLKVPFFKTFIRVTVPVCLPAILEISRYFFVNAMTTTSAVVFLYSPETMLASVTTINLEEAGDIGPAAAMATLIVATSTVVCFAYYLLNRFLERTTQSWRRPA